ncbi:MAG: exopolysaccharide biosynthesis protein, partial [Hyphomicrobiales bacterium]
MANAPTREQPHTQAARHDLTSLLDSIETRIDRDGSSPQGKLSLHDILEVVGQRAYGPMLLIIGILSVSPLSLIPGSTWTFAVLTLLVAIQMAFNKRRPWLPKSALNASFREKQIHAALKKVRPWTRAVDKIVRHVLG